MGYYMEQRGANFFIGKNNFPEMIKAIHDLANHPEDMGGGSYRDGKAVSKHYSWVNMSFSTTNDVEKIFNCWRWNVFLDDHGNITDISFDGEKMGDDRILFDAIAPYVEDNSFIEMVGEDNDMWRWKFKDGKCVESNPIISWE